MESNVVISSSGDSMFVQLIQVQSYSFPIGLVLYWLGYAVSVKDNKTQSTVYVNIDDAVKKSLKAARGEGIIDSQFESAKTFFLEKCEAYGYNSEDCTRNLVDVFNRAMRGLGY